jgi:spermidine/putrescine-binding protein
LLRRRQRLPLPPAPPTPRRCSTSTTGRITSTPETVKNFEAKYGIKVNYDVFDSNEVVETKLLAGNTGYDLVMPSAQFMERQIKAGVFQKLDKALLTNLGNMDPSIMQRVALHDPDNAHSIPYMWGTDGIGYNVDQIKQLMPDAPLDSWALVLDPKLAAKFKDCGISILDAASDIRSIVLIYLGKDPNSQDADDLKLVEEQLMKIRPYVRKINSSQYIEDLANGELCIAVGYSGDMLQARDRAREAGKGCEGGLFLAKGRQHHLVRHDGHSGRRQASPQCASVHRLPDAAASGREQFQRGALSERQSCFGAIHQSRGEERSQRLPQRRGESQAVA